MQQDNMKSKKVQRKKRAALYARYSPGPNQREESITGQFREGHFLCDKNDWLAVKEYADRSLTGRTDNRPQFQQMIKDAESGMFDVVICYKTDRFARDRLDAAIYKNKLKKLGIRVVYSKMSIPEGPEGIILESVLEGLDEYYSKDLSQKINRGMYDNALEGKTTGGPTPFGYLLDDNKKFVIDKDTSPIVREIFTRYATGEQTNSIYNDLNNRGIRTARGKLFNKNSLHRMFKNKKYIGIITYSSKDDDYEDIYNEDAMPAIIDKDLFKRVQERLRTNHKRTQNPEKLLVEFPLSGKFFDAACGGAFVGDSGTSETKVTHYYYSCGNRKIKRKCKTKSIRKDFVEDLVIDKTRGYILQDSVIEHIAECVVQLQEEKKDCGMLLTIKSEISETQKSLNNIMKAIEQGIYTETTKARLLELEDRKAQLESQCRMEEIRLNAPKASKEKVIYYLSQFATGDPKDEAYKKQIIDTFINSVVLDKDSLIIAYNYSGEHEVVEVDFKALKNSLETSVRMSSKWWRFRDDIRTFKSNICVDIDVRKHLFYCTFKVA